MQLTLCQEYGDAVNHDPLSHREFNLVIQEFDQLVHVRLGLTAEVRH
jgi:hypothetical protein